MSDNFLVGLERESDRIRCRCTLGTGLMRQEDIFRVGWRGWGAVGR